uniref:Uncharacterized protein n=1 Tax=Alexandrium catenella TaxID=2925 RepID=A0A7S1WJ36_ALECA|eukprot:CAMPEP_0171207486 /NCGR_PEP_ID=MMETSP0790-20130122/27597_1 /TAXON_ID=2925 /ORGANISM="Alexandrium catenella, Strain OF101" /LENGTH=350 /DNA_ID=CAMNT_0011673051 /DNA_START=91 /DNA_END=1143 /DNA_ORIENTATION=-
MKAAAAIVAVHLLHGVPSEAAEEVCTPRPVQGSGLIQKNHVRMKTSAYSGTQPQGLAFIQASMTASTTLPPSGPPDFGQVPVVIVVSRIASDDVRWLDRLTPIPHVLYTEPLSLLYPKSLGVSVPRPEVADPSNRPKPVGIHGTSTRECGAYLSFIIEHYHALPEVAVFLQGQPLLPAFGGTNADYHTDPHYAESVRKIGESPQRVDYCALNSIRNDWRTKGPAWYLKGWYEELEEDVQGRPGRFEVLNRTLRELLPEAGTQCFCCAQFAVSRQRIRRQTLAFYRELLDFLRHEWPSEEQGPRTCVRCSYLERVWHVIFGEPAVCEPAKASCRVLFEGASALAAVDNRTG